MVLQVFHILGEWQNKFSAEIFNELCSGSSSILFETKPLWSFPFLDLIASVQIGETEGTNNALPAVLSQMTNPATLA